MFQELSIFPLKESCVSLVVEGKELTATKWEYQCREMRHLLQQWDLPFRKTLTTFFLQIFGEEFRPMGAAASLAQVFFSKDCAGTHGRGVGTLKGSAGLRVGAEVSFSIGRWSLGSTGVSGGGKSDVAVPFNFVCSERTCGDLSWGEASSDANLFLSACAFGICFEKTF